MTTTMRWLGPARSTKVAFVPFKSRGVASFSASASLMGGKLTCCGPRQRWMLATIVPLAVEIVTVSFPPPTENFASCIMPGACCCHDGGAGQDFGGGPDSGVGGAEAMFNPACGSAGV